VAGRAGRGEVDAWLAAFELFGVGPHRAADDVDSDVLRQTRRMARHTVAKHAAGERDWQVPVADTLTRAASITVPVLAINGETTAAAVSPPDGPQWPQRPKWTIAGFVAASSALSACAAVMINGLPLPADGAHVRAAKRVASTEDASEPDPDVIVGSTAHKSGKHIALTFDDPFCLVGTNAQANPGLVRRIAEDGHALCDHTMTHDEGLPSLPAEDRKAEIAGCRDAIVAAAPDAHVRYFRAPAGAFSDAGDEDPESVQRIATRLGMQPLAWSIDTEDWTQPGVDAIVSAVRQAGDHDVVLLHDAGGGRQQTMTALETVLPWLVEQGYRFDLPA
jgi:hypothetical protein